MSTASQDERLVATKFAIGQPVRRVEDETLVRGQGQYTDDVNLDGQVYAAFVRSQVPHGIMRGIDTTTARALPGVLAVYTGHDIAAAGYGGIDCRLPLKNADGSALRSPVRPALPTDKVRFVGDPIACVIADTEAQAQDAAEAIELDIEPLEAVICPREAAATGAPLVWDEVPGNVALDFAFGDAAKVDAAFSSAAHVTKMRLQQMRLVVNAMEPRAVVADYDAASQRFTLYAPTQGVMGSRATAAGVMKVAPDKIRFIATNVGGSFGMKGAIFPEYVVALHATRALGRPVKWTDTRSESYLSDHHGRAQDFDAEMALDGEGHILAVRLDGYSDMGGYITALSPQFASLNVTKHAASVYRTPAMLVKTRCVLTNTVPITAYRGAGRPEGNYYIERLIDTAAREIGLDPVELRRRNLVTPDQMPFKSASQSVYDCGDFPAILNKALQVSDWEGYPARVRDSEARGKRRGRGVGQFLEVTAPVRNEQGSIHFQADGTVTVLTGTHDHGQGHATSFAQVVATRLGVPFEKITVRQTDSDLLQAGGGSGGSKSAMASGTALYEAGERVIEKAKLAASHILETDARDIRFANGQLNVVGTDRGLSIIELARTLATAPRLPADCPTSLDVDYVHDAAPPTYPNGCHICEVELDPDTGFIEVVKYDMVGDFGTLLNAMIVEGQLRGGVVQGLGQCLMERAVYNEDGQLVTGSLMDYAVPRAVDTPNMAFHSHGVPTATNPLGVKGCGEAGVSGALPAIANAIADVLAPFGVRHLELPTTPEAVWRAVHRRDQAA